MFASRRQSESRMIISQIIRIRLLQPPIPLSPFPLPILTLNKPEQRRAPHRTNPQHAQTRPIPRGILRRLGPNEDITRDDPAQIAKTDLHR